MTWHVVLKQSRYGKPGATDDEILEAARRANAYDFVQAFDDKFDTLVGERGVRLSGYACMHSLSNV